MKIKPVIGEQVKKNALGEPIRDRDGQPVMETVDQRDPREYLLYEPGIEKHIVEGATKGLPLWRADLNTGGFPEPIYLVYAKDEAAAKDVFLREMGIMKLAHDSELKVTKELA